MSNSASICCICLKTYPILEGIYDTDEKEIRHYDKLKLCIPNELWYKDYKLCKNCLDSLEFSYYFIKMCINSEKNRKEAYGKNKGPYVCSECSKSYKWELLLKKHVNQFHKDTGRILNELRDGDKAKSNNKHKIMGSIDLENILEPTELYEDEFKTQIANYETSEDQEQTHNNKEPLQAALLNSAIKCDTLDVSDLGFDSNSIKEESSCSSSDEKPQTKKYLKRLKTSKSSSSTRKGPYKCEYCEDKFKYIRDLRTHTWTNHNFVRPFSCDQCSATYKTSGALVIHKRIHSGERPYICTECGKGFRAGADLIRHTKTHSAKREYQCPYCDKSFKTSGNLHMHKNCVHKSTEDYKFQCNQCGHKFPFKGHLDNHLKRHAGIKNFSCHICQSKFILNAELDLHVRRVHRNEQRTNCEECSKEFKTLCGLRKHLKLAHNLGNYKYKVPERKFLCPYCPKMFPYNNKLQRHILTHTGEKPFKCQICSKGFRDKFDLKSHLANNHQMSLDAYELSNI